MKKRIRTAVAALLCVLTLCSAGLAPAYAAPPSDDEGGISAQFEEFRWYYRNNNGVEEMRLWSLTKGEWVTDWIPVPEDWLKP